MPTVKETPRGLKPYLFHGLEIEVGNDDHGIGECLLCGKRKFRAHVETGLFDCKSCGEFGNPTEWLRRLWELADSQTTDYDGLARDRGLLYPETLSLWGVAKSPLTGEWVVPAYSGERKLTNLYRYLPNGKGGRYLAATVGQPHGLFGACLYDPKKPNVLLCEGPWDGMALFEVLRKAKATGDGELALTGNESSSLFATHNVLATPGCNAFQPSWSPLFAGKIVSILYDSDHPRPHPTTGILQKPAGWAGARRVAEGLAGAAEPPSELKVLRWGKEGYDHDLPSGTDLRDLFKQTDDAKVRAAVLSDVLGWVEPIPPEWVAGRTKESRKSGGTKLELKPCKDWKQLRMAWMKSLSWNPGLDHALSCMLAVVVSTEQLGDPLWIKVVSPPSTGKTTLAEALSVVRQYVYPKDSMTGLISGFQVDKEGSENMSLADRIRNKTLVIKDGDTILSSPNYSLILSQLRALYDKAIRASYGNKMSNDFEGMNVSVIICGTNALRALDTSELGERTLDVVIMENIDPEQEDDVLWKTAYKAARNVAVRSNGQASSQDDAEAVLCKQLTGGYVVWLRENAEALLAAVGMADEYLGQAIALAKVVAHMRARPSEKKGKSAEAEGREFAARLVSQHVRLAKCLAVVLNKREVDADTMSRVKRVALDTARGKTLAIATELYKAGLPGLEAGQVGTVVQVTDSDARKLLRFLVRIEVAAKFTHEPPKGRKHVRYRLTGRMRELFGSVLDGESF